MKLQTQIPLNKADNPIDYSRQILLLGSCFSENIGAKLNYFKFRTEQNPFGILFHPLAIENLIENAVQQKKYTDKDVFFLNEQWHCFDAHSDLSATSKEDLLVELNSALGVTRNHLEAASHIIITLGTAWVYRDNETNQIVANCHKVPQKQFQKHLLSIQEIKNSLENTRKQIQIINKEVQIVFTISPVRHLKDGFIENQRSKAHLISAVHSFLSPRVESRGFYFPSYEIMMDELRDYRFYKTDMIHPNTLAIDYIWEKFCEVWISNETIATMKQVDEIQRGLNHRPFNPNSEQHQKFQKSLREKISYIKKEHPFMKFE